MEHPGKVGTSYGLAHTDGPGGARMRGKTCKFYNFCFFPGCVSGPSRAYFRNLCEKCCRTVGSRAPGTFCGSRYAMQQNTCAERTHGLRTSSAQALRKSADTIKGWPEASICSNHVPTFPSCRGRDDAPQSSNFPEMFQLSRLTVSHGLHRVGLHGS